MKREKKKKRSQESTFSFVTMNQSYSKMRENLKNPEISQNAGPLEGGPQSHTKKERKKINKTACPTILHRPNRRLGCFFLARVRSPRL